MAESSWPGPGPATVTEAQWEALAEGFWQSGLIGSPLDPAPVFADSTGMHVKIRAGTRARVRGQLWDAGDTDLVVQISANAAGSTRIDLVVLRLDRSTWLVEATVVEGTPGGGVPAVATDVGDTGEWDLIIGRVDVPAGESTSITPSMVAARTAYLGPVLEIANTGQPLGQQGAYPYRLRYAPAQDRLMLERPAGTVDLWRDTGWVQVTTLGQTISGWEVTRPTYARRVGMWVHLNLGNFERTGGAISRGTDTRIMTALPADYRYSGPQSVDATLLIGNDRPVRVVLYRHGSPTGRGNQIWVTNHGGIARGDTVYGTSMVWSV